MAGNRPLDELKFSYIEYIYRCNRSFAKFSNWWYLPSSSRERFGTFVQDKYVNQLLGKKVNNVSVNGFRFILQKFPTLKSILNLIRDNLLLIKILLRKKPALHRKVDILFIHPIHDLPIRKKNGSIWNHYFGELPEVYLKLGLNVEISGVNDPGVFNKDIIFQERGYRISNSLAYLKWRDLCVVNWQYVKHFLIGLKLPIANNEKESILYKLIQRESKTKLYNIFWGNIYKQAFVNIINQLNPNYVFHTYENNWWERSLNKAYNENSSQIKKCIGFIHCSILDSHLKYTLIQDEWSLKPGPDELIVTGYNALQILCKRSGYDKKKIKIGYDLRGPNLLNIQKKNRSSLRRILVLLEGLDTMPSFLWFILETIPMDVYKLSVRCHPVYPIQNPAFLEIRNHKLYNQLLVTENTSLEDDLQSADLVIYKGSTSALYAAYMGIPLLRYRDDWWASDDPLHYCNNLKKEFSTSEELLEGIQYFKDMDHHFFNEQKEKLQEYVYQYMRPYKGDELNKFAQELVS